MLCDAQIKNDCRLIILSSSVRVFNNTAFPLVILSSNSGEQKKVQRIEVNKDYHIPIGLLYADSSSSIHIGVDE
jgi:hypothetical protein